MTIFNRYVILPESKRSFSYGFPMGSLYFPIENGDFHFVHHFPIDPVVWRPAAPGHIFEVASPSGAQSGVSHSGAGVGTLILGGISTPAWAH